MSLADTFDFGSFKSPIIDGKFMSFLNKGSETFRKGVQWGWED